MMNFMKENRFFVFSLMLTVCVAIIDPEKGKIIGHNFLNLAINIGPLLLLMFAFLGILQVWLKSEKAKDVILGSQGFRAKIYASLLGIFIAGPIYPGFTLGKMLIEKGSRISTIIILLNVWATTKIALLPLEIKLLGLKFTIIRWIITIIMIFIVAEVCELVIHHFQRFQHRSKFIQNINKNNF